MQTVAETTATDTDLNDDHHIPPPLPPVSPEPVQAPLRKDARVAGLLGCFPGMGHIYDGLYLRGITFFTVVASLMAIAGESNHGLFGFAAAFAWIFSTIDAVRQATLINYGYQQDLGLADMPTRPKSNQGGLIMGVLLVAIGLYSSLEVYLDLDLDWVFDLWPMGLIAIGGWLMWGSLRDRPGTAGTASETETEL